MKHNLGNVDRVLRFVLGVWLIQWVLPNVQNQILWWVLLVLSLIALIESFIGYCWLHKMFGIKNA